jgi:hypothetical protein
VNERKHKPIIRVYVAGAYSGDSVLHVLDNIGRGVRASAALFRKGYAPYCPWHNHEYFLTGRMDGLTVEDYYRATITFMEVCNAIFVVDNPRNATSVGLRRELERAVDLGIPVFYDEEEMDKHYNWNTKKQ